MKSVIQLDNHVIYGNKIILRPISEQDTGLIVKWRNNPKVRDGFVFREPFTEKMHQNWLNTKVLSGEVVQYIIEEKSTGTPIGSIYYRDIDRTNECAEYGIFIGEDIARGKGYGTEAGRLFLDFGFEKLKLHRIFLRVFADNTGAVKSYEKAGFIQEGLFKDFVKIDGKFKNMVFMAVVK